MENLFEKIKCGVQNWFPLRADAMEERRQRRLDEAAKETIQVMEYEGELYVSVNGIPLFRADMFKDTFTSAGDFEHENKKLVTVLIEVRNNYKQFHTEEIWKRLATIQGSIRF